VPIPTRPTRATCSESTGTTPPIGAATMPVKGGPESVRALMLRCTQPFNLSGSPAISLPCGTTPGGLPIGLQLVGRRGGTAALAQAAAEADAAKQAALASLREQLDTAASTNMAEAEAEWRRTMAEREAALQGEKQLELETREQEHSKQLATLGRKLADTETELAGAREREMLNEERSNELEGKLNETTAALTTTNGQLAETREMRDRLQSDLDETKEARDGLRQELDTSRTQVELLSGNKRDLESRVGSLEAVKSQLETKLSMAMQKIATDEALLQRVRKAMAIGLGLLEEQASNTYGDPTSEMAGVSEDAE